MSWKKISWLAVEILVVQTKQHRVAGYLYELVSGHLLIKLDLVTFTAKLINDFKTACL